MKKFLFGLILCLYSSFASAAQIRASVNRSEVPLGEVFMLTLTAEGNVPGEPDFSVLSPTFKIYSRTVSKQDYVINGNATSTMNWQLGLISLKPGIQQIPAIHIGTEQSAPIEIKVLDIGEAPTTTNTQVAPEASFSMKGEVVNPPKAYYVQQELNYNIILTDSGGLQGGEPVFENNNNDWLILSLGNPDISTEVVNGQTQRKIIFKYAMFAQKSGQLEIPAATFDGYVLGDPLENMSLDFGGIFNIGMQGFLNIERPVSLRAPAQSINVLPASPEAKDWWLPAKNVTLKAEMLTPASEILQGEPFRRQITLEADGISFTQLPEISFPATPNFKQYAEKTDGINLLRQGLVAGQKKVTNVYVPEKAGQLTIPEISVDWFNTTTQKMERAVVPAQTINVAASDALNAESAPKEQEQPEVTSETTPEPQTNPAPKPEAQLPQDTSLQSLWIVLAVIVAFLAGLFLSAFLFRRHGEKPQCETRQFPKYILQKAYQNDYRSLRDALVSWATGFYPEKTITNLNDVANAANMPEFKEQIDILIQNLYGTGKAETFNAKVFADTFQKILKQKRKQKETKTPLPPLYD